MNVAKRAKKDKKNKKKKKKAEAPPRTGHTDAVMGLSWNPLVRCVHQQKIARVLVLISHTLLRVACRLVFILVSVLVNDFCSPSTGRVRCSCAHMVNDRNLLASSSADGTTIIWDLENGAQLHRLSHHRDKVQSVRWHPTRPRYVHDNMMLALFFSRICRVEARENAGSSDSCITAFLRLHRMIRLLQCSIFRTKRTAVNSPCHTTPR